MAGSATFTIVWSRMTISIPAHRTTRANQRESRGRGVVIDSSWFTDTGRTVADDLDLDDLLRDYVARGRLTGFTHSGGCASRSFTSRISALANTVRSCSGSEPSTSA